MRTVITLAWVCPCIEWASIMCCDHKPCPKLGEYKSSNTYHKYLSNQMFITGKDSDFYDCHDQHLEWTYFSQDSSKRNQNGGRTEICIYHAKGNRKNTLKNNANPK